MRRLLILTLAAALSFFPTIWAQDQNVYEVGKEGDAPDPPTVTPLTEREICGDWKAEKIGDNDAPVDDLYIYYGDKGFAFEGKYKDWHGGATATKETTVTIWRTPKADEMSDKAPQWAREKIAKEGKLEWKLSLKAESQKGEWVLEGKWYPGQFKWSENQWSETGEASEAGREASYLDEGKPVDVKFKKVPAIVGDPIVLNNQTGSNKGFPWNPYPYIFRPPAGTVKTESHSLVPPPGGGETRTLFVCGVNLPTNYNGKIDIRGSDKTVSYRLMTLATDTNLNSDRKRLLKVGWDAALKGLDRDTEKTVRKCAAMLIRADLQRGVTPGVKSFAINGMAASWRLRFGDDGGLLTFAREITAEENQDIDCAYLPEKIYIEIRTDNALPTQEIPLRVQLNGKDVQWNGSDTIVAKYAKDIPTPQSYEVPRAGEPAEIVPKFIRVYRTPTIQLGGETSANSKGYQLQAKAEDVLRVRPDDPYLITLRPVVALVKIWDAPDRDADANLVGTWQETLERAAYLDGLGERVKAGQNVAGTEATHFSNVVVTNIAIGKLRPVGQAIKGSFKDSLNSWTTVTPLWPAALWWRFFFGNEGILTERVTVTVAEHAALLLFKEAFIRKMSIGLNGLEKITNADSNPAETKFKALKAYYADRHRAMLLGLREMLKSSATKESSPWESIRVPGPDGGDVKMSWALDDGLRKAACKGCSDGRTEDWSLEAVENGLNQYKDAIKHAIQKAKDTPDNDIKKLIELIGYGYENLAPEVMQHMMWHPPDSSDPNWQPNHNARGHIWHLHTAADSIRAQEDLSKLDTQVVLAVGGALAAPFLQSASFALRAVAFAYDCYAGLGHMVITESIPESYEEYTRDDLRFALGASLILGTDRLNEAELKRTEWYQTTLNVLIGALGVGQAGYDFHLSNQLAKVKASLVVGVVEKHGLPGAKNLTTGEKQSILTAASEAEMLKDMHADKLLQKSQERAAAIGERLGAEAGAPRSARSEAPKNKIQASGSAVHEEPKPLNAQANPQRDVVHKSDVDPLFVPLDEPVPEPGAPKKLPTGEGPQEQPRPPPVKSQSEGLVGGEKTPRILRTADDFRELFPPQQESGAKPPQPNVVGAQVRVRVNGETVDLTLGNKIGEGGFAGVWEIADGPPKYKGKVVKLTFIDNGETFRLNPDAQRVSRAEAERLTNLGYREDVEEAVRILDGKNNTGAKFEYAPIRATGADENVACVIQDKINAISNPAFAKEGDCLILTSYQKFLQFADKHGLADAVVELYWELAQAGVVWEDGKLSNMYFRFKDGKWIAGVLDVDRVFLHANRAGRRGAFLDWVESINVFYMSTDGKTANVNSLRNSTRFPWTLEQGTWKFASRSAEALVGPYLLDAEEFMMIMFEYHGWVGWDPTSKKFFKRLIDPKVIEKQIFPGHTEPLFPRLSDEARFKPRNLDKPYRAAFLEASEPARAPPGPPKGPPPPSGPDGEKPPPPAAGGGNAPPPRPPAPPGGAGANPPGPPSGEARAGWIPEKGQYLDDLLKKNYDGKPQPPMHTTNVESLEKIRSSGILEAPISGASWSFSGTLREGNVAVRLTDEGKNFVVFERASEGTGLIPKYFENGVKDGKGVGNFKSYVPAKYLEYYNWKSDAWIPVKR